MFVTRRDGLLFGSRKPNRTPTTQTMLRNSTGKEGVSRRQFLGVSLLAGVFLYTSPSLVYSKGQPQKGIEAGLRRDIESAFQTYHYGKHLTPFLAPNSSFRAVFEQNYNVVLRNFYELSAQTPFTRGVCEELSLQMGRQLEKSWGEKYIVLSAAGGCNPYFRHGGHNYLLMWPKSQDADFRVQLASSPNRLPAGAILIDPTFKRYGLVGQSQDIQSYSLHSTRELKFLERKNLPFFFEEENISNFQTLGYLRELLPEARTPQNKNDLLFIGFKKNNQRITPILGCVSPASDLKICTALLKKALPTNELAQFFTQLQNQLNAPSPQVYSFGR